jgi:hypothetical protein
LLRVPACWAKHTDLCLLKKTKKKEEEEEEKATSIFGSATPMHSSRTNQRGLFRTTMYNDLEINVYRNQPIVLAVPFR